MTALAPSSGLWHGTTILTVRKAGGSQQEYLKIKLNDILVSSYAIGGSEGGAEGEPQDVFAA